MRGRICVLAFYLFLSNTVFAGIGVTDWAAKTPWGNEINNFSNTTLYLRNGVELTGLAEWYFYKNHIVGRLGNKNHYGDTTGYFVVNEITNSIDTFQTKRDWEVLVTQTKLKPRYWTRWHNKSWKVLNGRVLFALYYSFPTFIFVLVLLIFFIRKAWVKEKFQWKKPFTAMLLIMLIGLLSMLLLGSFPQSF
ncbi:MAG: hypothetical protein H6607_01700 [Flavobacteriales bacterium]|nr:hypothetical protein [Flavobacteriales bacterium]